MAVAEHEISDLAVKSVLSDLLGQFADIDWVHRVLAKRVKAMEAAQVLRDILATHSTD